MATPLALRSGASSRALEPGPTPLGRATAPGPREDAPSFAEPETTSAESAPAAPRYAVSIAEDWAAVEGLWSPLMRAGVETPFQDAPWLAAWYGHPGRRPGVAPLLITVRDGASGRIAAALPWALSREGGMRVVGFADDGITDYNAALLGPAAPEDAAGWARLARAVRSALPPADLLRLEKLAGAASLWPGAQDSSLYGNVIRTGESWDAHHRSQERSFRKELERSWRVFGKHDGAAFRCLTDPVEAAPVMDALERLQRERIAEIGAPYILDRPDLAGHYRALLVEGLARGTAVLTALCVGEEVVAALFGLRREGHYAMVRLAVTGDPAWRNTSPGRLLIARTMEHLHGDGARTFDFTIGEYAYKRRFNVEAVPLKTVLAPLSLRGWVPCAADAARRAARRHPALVRLRTRLKGTAPVDMPPA